VTAQEQLWRGEFGDAYVDRNEVTDERLAALTQFWAGIMGRMEGAAPRSILEVGANIGLNLRTIKRLTTADLYALDPTQKRARG
jgi:hypothetical protein